MAASAGTKTVDDIDDDVDAAIRNLLQCPICVELYQIPASYTPTHTAATNTDASADPGRGSHAGSTPTRTASRRDSRAQKASASPDSPAPSLLRLPCRMPSCCGQRVCLTCLVRNMDINANKCPLCNRQGLRSLMRRLAGKETEMMDKVAADALAEWRRLHAGGRAPRVEVMEQMRVLLQTLAPHEANVTAELVDDKRTRDGALCPPGMIGEEYQEHIAKLRRDDLETELRSLQEMLGSGVLERAVVADVKRRIAGITAELTGEVPPVTAPAGQSTAPSGVGNAPDDLAGEVPLVPEAPAEHPSEPSAGNNSAVSEVTTAQRSVAALPAQPGSRPSVAKAASTYKQSVMHGQETLLSWARDHADRRHAAVAAKGSANSSAAERAPMIPVIELHDDWDIIDDAAQRLDAAHERMMNLVLAIERYMSGKNFDDAEAVVNEVAAVAGVLRNVHRQRRGASSASADAAMSACGASGSILSRDNAPASDTEAPAAAPAVIAPTSEYGAHPPAAAPAATSVVPLHGPANVGQRVVMEPPTSRRAATEEGAHVHAGADLHAPRRTAMQPSTSNAEVAMPGMPPVATDPAATSPSHILTPESRQAVQNLAEHRAGIAGGFPVTPDSGHTTATAAHVVGGSSDVVNAEAGDLRVAVHSSHNQDALPGDPHGRSVRAPARTAEHDGPTARALLHEHPAAMEGASPQPRQHEAPARQTALNAGRAGVRQSRDGQHAASATKHPLAQVPRDTVTGTRGAALALPHEVQAGAPPIVIAQQGAPGEHDSRLSQARPPQARSEQFSNVQGSRTCAANDNPKSSHGGDEPPKPNGKERHPFGSMCLSDHAPDSGAEDAAGIPTSSRSRTGGSEGPRRLRHSEMDERVEHRGPASLESAPMRTSPPASSQSRSTASASSARSWDSSRPGDIQPISHPIDSLRRADAARPAQQRGVATSATHTYERSGGIRSRSNTIHGELEEVDLSCDPDPRPQGKDSSANGSALRRSMTEIGSARPSVPVSKTMWQEWLPAPPSSRRAAPPRPHEVPVRASAGGKEARSISMHDFLPARKAPRMHPGFPFPDPPPTAAKMSSGAAGFVDLAGADDSDYEGPR